MTTLEWTSYHVELVIDARTTAHTVEEALPSAVATNCKSLVLRASNELDTVSNGAAIARALTLCPNVQCLRMPLSQGALEYISQADLNLAHLRTLEMQCHNPITRALAGILLQCPNLQMLSLGTLGRELRQTGPAPRVCLPQLTAYRQATAQDVFLEPLYACARTLRTLTLVVHGPLLLDLGHLHALSPLALTMMGGSPTPLDKQFRFALLRLRTLRHLALEYLLAADSLLFDAVAMLMPQLVTLSVRARGHAGTTTAALATQLPDVIRGGRRTALRALRVEVECYDAVRLAMLRDYLGACCRPRRVRLSVESLV